MTEHKISVLGTPYVVQIGTHEELKLEEYLAGDCCVHTKVIRLRTDFEHNGLNCWRSSIRATFRHELAHAMLYESGFISMFDNDTLVEWLEVNTPKLVSLDDEFHPFFDIHFKS